MNANALVTQIQIVEHITVTINWEKLRKTISNDFYDKNYKD